MNLLRQNGTLTDSLWNSLRNGESGLQTLPGLLKRCLREECWKERFVDCLKEVVTCATFEEFVTRHPPEGLGTDTSTLRNLCRGDREVEGMIDEAVKRPHGGDRKSKAAIKIDIVNLDKVPDGNSKDAALRRLRKDRPDLYKEVVAGDLSPHAAMVEAGFRSVPTPLDLGRKAWGKMSKAERKEFRAWLDTPEANG